MKRDVLFTPRLRVSLRLERVINSPRHSWQGGNFYCQHKHMKMEQKSHEMISSTTELQTDFQAVDGVVQSWMIDYYFTSLCRLFRDRSAGKFRKTLNIFQGKGFLVHLSLH